MLSVLLQYVGRAGGMAIPLSRPHFGFGSCRPVPIRATPADSALIGHIFPSFIRAKIMPVQQPFVAEKERKPGYTHVLLITTGSVASIKAPLIVSKLLSVCRF